MVKEKQKKSRIWWITGSAVLMTVGFAVIPSLIEKCSRKVYKSRLNNQNVNMDSLGPKIVKNKNVREEE